MVKLFRFRAVTPVNELLDRIYGECASAGLRMNRRKISGSIEGMGVRAAYEISTESLDLVVNRIPFLVSWGMVENEISKRSTEYGMVVTGTENT